MQEQVAIADQPGAVSALAGVLTCARCGHRYVGGAAHGRNARYRYYRCFTRQRYGADRCDADYLPADALEAAVIESLSATYARGDLVDKAIADYRSGATSAGPQLSAQLALTDAEIRKAEEAIDRYLRAFENGALSEAHCGTRVRTLAERLAELRSRRADLTDELGDCEADDAGELDAAGIQRDLAALLATDAPAATKKALLQTLIEDVSVTSRGDPADLPGAAQVSGSESVRSGGGGGNRTRVRNRVPCDLYERSPGTALTGAAPWDRLRIGQPRCMSRPAPRRHRAARPLVLTSAPLLTAETPVDVGP